MRRTIRSGSTRIRSVVYGYRFPSWPGKMKIGYSSRGIERIREQSTAFPEIPEVMFVIHDKRAKDLEKAFHMALSDRQAKTMGVEWFDVGMRDVLAISPRLRRAAGWTPWRMRIRRIALTLSLAAGAGLYAPVLGSLAKLSEGGSLADARSVFGAFGARLRTGDLEGLARGTGRVFDYVGGLEQGVLLHGGAVALALMPALVIFLSGPRQVR